MNLEKIKKRYNIQTDDLDEIEKMLKKEMCDLHPDNCGEDFEKDKFEEVKSYYEYVASLKKGEKQEIALSDVFDLMLTKIIDNSVNEQEDEKKQLCKELKNNIEKQLDYNKKKLRFRGISLATITGFLTWMYALPETFSKNAVLKNVLNFHYDLLLKGDKGTWTIPINFTIIWIIALVITCTIWIVIFSSHCKEKHFTEQLELEVVQNNLFMKFITMTQGTFDKNDFIQYLTKYAEDNVKPLGYIDDKIIQNISDIIINRALEKGIIRKTDSLSLIDSYILVERE